MYKFYEKIETDNILMSVYKFTDENENIFGVIMPINTDIEYAKNQLIEYLNNPEDSPLGLS